MIGYLIKKTTVFLPRRTFSGERITIMFERFLVNGLTLFKKLQYTSVFSLAFSHDKIG